ncbi:MAG TPA: FG-GAP repeat protein, partial [Polyangiaceae bacterium]|nr:FG-GAP repeat protein [Polyangiaceae bacterium]
LSAPVEVKPQNCPASNFGESIAIDGDTMVIGAPGVSADQTEGVAYVYVRAGSTWVEQAQLAVPSLPLNTRFGHAVAVSGNTVVVGAPDSSNDRSGSAHVFVYQYGGWSLQESLEDGAPTASDRFGNAVSIQGDRLLVGAPGSTWPGFPSGKAVLFTRKSSKWKVEKTFSDPPGDLSLNFGYSVALAAPWVFIGSPGGSFMGKQKVVYYESTSSGWKDCEVLEPSKLKANSRFGSSISVSGSLLAVGAPEENDSVPEAGAVFVFHWNGTKWEELDKLKVTPPVIHGAFGKNLSVSGHRIIAGMAPADKAWLYAVRGDLGTPCGEDDACASGHCVDGVCCDGPCGGGVADDCEACLKALGATKDGICTALQDTSCHDDDPCTDTAICVDGTCQRSTSKSDGAPCPSGTCQGGTCVDTQVDAGDEDSGDSGMAGQAGVDSGGKSGSGGMGGGGTGDGAAGIEETGGGGTGGAQGRDGGTGGSPRPSSSPQEEVSSFYACGVRPRPMCGLYGWLSVLLWVTAASVRRSRRPVAR